jgi:hypothetical protein
MTHLTKQPEPATPATPPAAPTLDPAWTEAAFHTLAARLAAIPCEQLEPVDIDVQTASVVALGISRCVAEPELRGRFAQLASSCEIDDACVDGLLPAAQAAWYAGHRYLLERATRSEARLPVAVVETAHALRGRLLRLAADWLCDDPVVAAELTTLRAGTGYQDLANDLVAVAVLCDRHRPLLAQDRKLYQAGDIALARQLSTRIAERLGTSATVERNSWVVAQARAWTHLARTYDQVRRGGRLLFAGEEGEARFPSLVTAARARGTLRALDHAAS